MKQWQRPNRAKYHRNLVLKVKRYNLDKNVAGCYPGAVEGEIIGGPLQDKVVSVYLNRTHSNDKVSKFEDIAQSCEKIHTSPEGI